MITSFRFHSTPDRAAGNRRRSGFTLVELLVVIAIIGVLVGLLLPAVQAAREAARRMQCSNNLKQLGLAIHNYEGVHKRIPPCEVWDRAQWTAPAAPGRVRHTTWGWSALVIPFVELTNLHTQLNPDGFQLPTVANQPIQNETLPVFTCPSCPGGTTNPYYNNSGKSNYLASQAVFWAEYLWSPYNTAAKFSSITDGLSNTILIGERFLDSGGSWKSTGGVWIGRTGGSNAMIHGRGAFPPNTPYPGPAGRAPTGGNDPLGVRTAWTSMHTGGVNIARCDGSVQFLSQNIDSVTNWPHSRYTNFYRMEEVYSAQELNRVYQNLYRPNDGNVNTGDL